MATENENKTQTNTPSFDEDEDNNPFSHSHQGLVSLMSEHTISKNFKQEDNRTDDDESILLYNTTSKGDSKVGKDAYNTIQINYESRVTKLLKPNSNVKIQITEAGNSNEGMSNSSKKYVVYTIKLISNVDSGDEIQTRRRYSDFESLRDVLSKIFPLVIIPPIPPKNYFNFTMLNGLVGQANNNSINHTTNGASNYSYINSNRLNKNKLIEHRKRLLTNFLNNCLEIPQIRNLEFFAKFLDPNANWSDEITLITSQLPKSIYLSNPENGLKTDPIYNNLPNPVSNHTMSFLKDNKKRLTKRTNKLLTNSETTATNKASNIQYNNSELSSIINTSNLDDVNKEIMDNFIGLSNDYTELGTIFNSFSLILSESPRTGKTKSASEEDEAKLNIIFDKIGQVFDRSYITINTLIGDLETKFSEPLGEAVQYSSILQFIIKFQQRKIRQRTLLDNDLIDKRKELEELLKAEEESSRIEHVLNSQVISKNSKYDLSNAITKTCPLPAKPSSSTSSKFKIFPSINSFKKITQYVTDIIDQNPEQTRKQKITTLQNKISILEKCQGIMLEDINYITDEINKNFRSFHSRQLKMIYEILLSYNGFLVSWAKKNVDIWEEIRDEIEKL